MSVISPPPVSALYPGLFSNVWGGISSVTDHGYIRFGPASATRAHVSTDRAEFFFNAPLRERGHVVFSGGNVSSLRASVFERAHIRCEKAPGAGGGAAVGGTWQLRELNTIVENLFAWSAPVTISGNQITVAQPGTYRVSARAPAGPVGVHQCRLFDVTGSTVAAWGGVVAAHNGSIVDSVLNAKISVTGTTVFELQTRTQHSQGDGLGFPSNFGGPEVYSEIIFERV